MKKENVIEPIRVGTQAISSATDAAVMVLRIDDVIAARSGGGAGPGPRKGGGGGEGGGDGEDFRGPPHGGPGGPHWLRTAPRRGPSRPRRRPPPRSGPRGAPPASP